MAPKLHKLCTGKSKFAHRDANLVPKHKAGHENEVLLIVWLVQDNNRVCDSNMILCGRLQTENSDFARPQSQKCQVGTWQHL